jgi:hypothetical protein
MVINLAVSGKKRKSNGVLFSLESLGERVSQTMQNA